MNPSSQEPFLKVEGLVKTFPTRGGGVLRAVDGVSFQVAEGEALGLVGESGCGKSTTGRMVLRLLEADEGTVLFRGTSVRGLDAPGLFRFRREAQIVFQDPFSSLNPRMTVRQIIAEPLKIHHTMPGQEDREVQRLLERVGLRPEHADRYPFQFSGGQRQRISIARALALQPRLLVADEPVSALDVSVQAQIVNLLQDLQEELGLALLFISHNLAIVRHLCKRTAVMRAGQIVEQGSTERIFAAPEHPYTKELLKSILM